MVPNLATRLGPLSRFLEEISRDFLNVAVDCRFINVYQEVDGDSRDQPVWQLSSSRYDQLVMCNNVNISLQVLPPYSATMGVVHENIVARERNHEDLVTFSSDEDPVFLEIAKAIRAGK